MENNLPLATRQYLAEIAEQKAKIPFHGFLENDESNLKPIIDHFPKWNVIDEDKMWCAAFVYYCCTEAGFAIPYSPDECITCSLAGCGGWEEFAIGDKRIAYHRECDFEPEAGDIVLFDYVFCDKEHDHIGIVVQVLPEYIVTAEGNVGHTNTSAIVRRPRDWHIRGYIRLHEGFRY